MKTLFKKKPAGQSAEMALQITSMADIFTIILVFLLKGLASGAVNASPPPGITLPGADGSGGDALALKVELTREAVLVDSKPAGALRDGRFSAGADLTLLAQAFRDERSKREAIARVNPDVRPDGKFLVFADRDAQFGTVRTVLDAAGAAGFDEAKFAVVGEGSR